jgi:hypothetical protein
MFGTNGQDNAITLRHSVQVVDTTAPKVYCKKSRCVTESGVREAGFIEEHASTGVEDCCDVCEQQQWTRIVGSTVANDGAACAYFAFNSNTNKCRLYGIAARTATLAVVAGSTGGYPLGCGIESVDGIGHSDEDALGNPLECSYLPEDAFVDPGVRCIDFHDSLTSGGALADTALSSTISTTGTINMGFPSGDFTVSYTCKDLSNNNAASMIRTVRTVDTIDPVLKITTGSKLTGFALPIIDDLITVTHEGADVAHYYLVEGLLNKVCIETMHRCVG